MRVYSAGNNVFKPQTSGHDDDRVPDVPLINMHIVSPHPFISNTVKSTLIDYLF